MGILDQASNLLGWNNYFNFSEGATDYISTDAGLRVNYTGHMSGSDGCSEPFSAYIFAGGINDAGYPAAQIQAAAYSAFSAALACSPTAVVLVFGPVPHTTGYTPALQQVDVGIKAAVAQMQQNGEAVYYLASPGALGWYLQNLAGCTQAASDPVYCTLSGDKGSHPTQYWHLALGSDMAPLIRAQAPWLVSDSIQTALPANPISTYKHRLPEVSGTWTFTVGSATITAVGGNATSTLLKGDLIYNLSQAGTYTVASVVGDNTVVLTSPIAGSALAGKIQLAFYPFPVVGTVAPSVDTVPGSFNFAAATPGNRSAPVSTSTVLAANDYTLTVSFPPTDAVKYAPVSAAAELQVDPVTPSITWAPPVPITYGAALGPAQLNASANVPGTFTYSPGTGAILPSGENTLKVTFTPND